MKKSFKILILFILIILFFQCSQKVNQIPFTEIEDLSGEYIAYAKDYITETEIIKKGENIYKIKQIGINENIQGIAIKRGDFLYAAIMSDSGMGVSIYKINDFMFDGVWTDGGGEYYKEVIVRDDEKVGNYSLSPLKYELSDKYEIAGENVNGEYVGKLYVDKDEDIVDFFWEINDSIQGGITIIDGDIIAVEFFDEYFEKWGIAVYVINEDGSLEGERAAFGDWKIYNEKADIEKDSTIVEEGV